MKSSLTFELKGNLNTPGFRPFMWKLVSRTSLGGWVSDCASGVLLHLEGENDEIILFIKSLQNKLPRYFHLLSIRLVERCAAPSGSVMRPFRLIGSAVPTEYAPPDRAPCPECIAKMLDPNSRNYRYPFTFCEKCGPGFSIVQQAPFSRGASALRAFPQCHDCAEAENPFQMCKKCGPSMFLMNPDGSIIDADDPIAEAAEKLADGKILAVKNYDGFICVCDAFCDNAIRSIRSRKDIPNKSISIMARDLQTVEKYCICSSREKELLRSSAAPLVVLRVRADSGLNMKEICPDYPETIGISLPPTGIMRLLFERLGKQPFDLLAFSGGPHPVDPEDAGNDADFAEVARVSDFVLQHDLRIWQQGGCSVYMVDQKGETHTIRRSRGVAPMPVKLPFLLKRNVLALGSDESTAVALGTRSDIFISQQIGNIRNERDSHSLYLAGEQLAMICARVPEMIVCDMGMNNFSSQEALRLSEQYRIPLATAQRHHANALACMAEHGLPEALALIFDGGSNGPDGTVWGAEAMEISYSAFHRFATFAPFEMNHPMKRTQVPGFLLARYMDNVGLPFTEQWMNRLNLSQEQFEQWRNGGQYKETFSTHAALTLFDAVAALIGFAPVVRSYDCQVLLLFDALLNKPCNESNARKLSEFFKFECLEENELFSIDWSPFFRNLEDPHVLQNEPAEDLLHGFLDSFAEAAFRMIEYSSRKKHLQTVLLSGKVFISPGITDIVQQRLEKGGFKVKHHMMTAPDETSVCIGQAIFGGMSY